MLQNIVIETNPNRICASSASGGGSGLTALMPLLHCEYVENPIQMLMTHRYVVVVD